MLYVGEANGQGTSPKCGVQFNYHFIIGLLFALHVNIFMKRKSFHIPTSFKSIKHRHNFCNVFGEHIIKQILSLTNNEVFPNTNHLLWQAFGFQNVPFLLLFPMIPLGI